MAKATIASLTAELKALDLKSVGLEMPAKPTLANLSILLKKAQVDLAKAATAEEDPAAEEAPAGITASEVAIEINNVLGWSPALITEGEDTDLIAAMVTPEEGQEESAAQAIVEADRPEGPAPVDGEGVELPRFTVAAWNWMVENGVLAHLGKKAKVIGKAKDKGTPKAKAEKKAPKASRADVFAGIIKAGPINQADLVAKMEEIYGGSSAEAAFQTNTFTRLLLAMGLMKKNEDGTFEMV